MMVAPPRELVTRSCRKIIKVEYAHQLKSSFSAACHECIHGHSGIIELILTGDDKVNNDYMVIDFGEIGAWVKQIIMDRYDHALFMHKDMDPEYLEILSKFNKKLRIVPINPTAEYFAEEIFNIVNNALIEHESSVRVEEVKFHETETGYASYKRCDLMSCGITFSE